MLIKTMRDARNILAVSEEEYARLTQQALRSPLPVILHALNLLQEALEHMSRGADRRIEMEMTLLKLCAPELDSSMNAAIRRIEALERGAPRAVVQAAQSTQAPKAEKSASPVEPPAQKAEEKAVPLPEIPLAVPSAPTSVASVSAAPLPEITPEEKAAFPKPTYEYAYYSGTKGKIVEVKSTFTWYDTTYTIVEYYREGSDYGVFAGFADSEELSPGDIALWIIDSLEVEEHF